MVDPSIACIYFYSLYVITKLNSYVNGIFYLAFTV